MVISKMESEKIMRKSFGFVAITCLLLYFCGCSAKVITNETSEKTNQSADYPTNSEINYGFLDHKMFNDYLTDGKYRCGSDFEPGDYYIFSLYGAEALYGVCDNPNDFSWSYYRVMRKVSVNEGQYVYLSSGAILVSSSEVNRNDWKKYGVFLVGTDLPEGDYKIASLEDRYSTELENISGICGAYQISENNPENVPKDCYPLFDKQTYISVENGQYVIINNARMTLAGAEVSNDVGETVETNETEQDIDTYTPKDKYSSLTNSEKKAICEYIQSRYDYYDLLNGGYAGDKYSDTIMQEAADKYGIIAEQAFIIWCNMYSYR